MKALKIILIVIAILIAVPLIAALFIKSEYTVEREITINTSKQQVFDYVKLLKSQESYNKWVMQDPAAEMNYTGTDGTTGAVVAWDSKKMNSKGEQEITGITEGSKVDWELRFQKPFEGVSHSSMVLEPVSDNQTKVKWTFVGNNKYPMTIMNLFIDKLLGGDMQESGNNLKTNLEK